MVKTTYIVGSLSSDLLFRFSTSISTISLWGVPRFVTLFRYFEIYSDTPLGTPVLRTVLQYSSTLVYTPILRRSTPIDFFIAKISSMIRQSLHDTKRFAHPWSSSWIQPLPPWWNYCLWWRIDKQLASAPNDRERNTRVPIKCHLRTFIRKKADGYL